ncbi:hypothetical protein XAR_3572 [Xanthomonas citri pv. glycines str. 8ra]|nr:hypothetical protein XAR_3572 [Xanthomonas citri pv. glycines str. 8ra]
MDRCSGRPHALHAAFRRAHGRFGRIALASARIGCKTAFAAAAALALALAGAAHVGHLQQPHHGRRAPCVQAQQRDGR